jgi:hypothetical protein
MTDAITASITPAAPPAQEPTAAEASTQLAAKKADPTWLNAFLGGSGPHVAEFRKLTEIAAKATDEANVEAAMAGKYLPFNDGEHLARMGTASMLREEGIGDDVIRQALSGKPVSRAEHEAATKRKADLMRDHEWSKQYLAGNGPQRQEMMLLNIIVSSDVNEESAA